MKNQPLLLLAALSAGLTAPLGAHTAGPHNHKHIDFASVEATYKLADGTEARWSSSAEDSFVVTLVQDTAQKNPANDDGATSLFTLAIQNIDTEVHLTVADGPVEIKDMTAANPGWSKYATGATFTLKPCGKQGKLDQTAISFIRWGAKKCKLQATLDPNTRPRRGHTNWVLKSDPAFRMGHDNTPPPPGSGGEH